MLVYQNLASSGQYCYCGQNGTSGVLQKMCLFVYMLCVSQTGTVQLKLNSLSGGWTMTVAKGSSSREQLRS